MLIPITKSNKEKDRNSYRTVDRLIIFNRAVRLYCRNFLYKILDPPLTGGCAQKTRPVEWLTRGQGNLEVKGNLEQPVPDK